MNSKLQQAFNVVVKYGFCGDCRWNFESSNCVKHDCYENCVSVIQDALDSIDAEPVVRCKDCKFCYKYPNPAMYYRRHSIETESDFYCGDGEDGEEE